MDQNDTIVVHAMHEMTKEERENLLEQVMSKVVGEEGSPAREEYINNLARKLRDLERKEDGKVYIKGSLDCVFIIILNLISAMLVTYMTWRFHEKILLFISIGACMILAIHTVRLIKHYRQIKQHFSTARPLSGIQVEEGHEQVY